MLQGKHSEAFLAVAETGSFEQAAIRLNITASAVTLRVQNLEKQLGHLLIVRERPCRVTQAGQSLLHYLQHSRLLEQSLLQSLSGKSAESAFYQINLAVNSDSLSTWLLPLLETHLKKNKIVIHFQVDDQSQTHHLLEAGLANACVTTESQAMKGCIAEYLGSMHYRFVTTPEFATQWFKQGISRDALRQAPALIFNEKDYLHTEFIQKKFGLNSTQYPHYFVPTASAFVDAIRMGLGYGWLPDFQSKYYLEEGSLIELSPDLNIELPLYWHHWKQQSVQLEQLTQLLVEHAEELMN